jgi:hypothetical protein
MNYFSLQMIGSNKQRTMWNGFLDIASGSRTTKSVVQGNVDKTADFCRTSLSPSQHDGEKKGEPLMRTVTFLSPC